MVSAFLAGVGEAGVSREVSFAKGSNSTLMAASVIRGESDQYFLTATAGQKMEVSISAPEKNAAFAIYQPGYKAGKDATASWKLKGRLSRERARAKTPPHGRELLPSSGTYLILVGPTQGNATYKLKVAIH